MTLRVASQSGGFLRPTLTSSLPARTSRITKATFITSSYHFTVPTNSFSNTQQKPPPRSERSILTPFVRRMSQKSMTSRIAILGSGEVGSTIAYSLILNPVAGEILLIDPKEDVRDAQVQDLSDATFHGNTSTQVRAGTHKEAGKCDIVVITAGAAQKKGESRTDLVGRNLKILSSAIDDMKPFREDTIIVLVSNPVDILTYFAQKFSGLPKHQVIGSGTFLDSARLRGILAQKCGVAASSIDAYYQKVAWSHASVGGVPLELALPDASIDKSAIAEDTKKKAAAIMESKGATAYGIGGVTSSICKSILFDQCNIRPISSYQDDMNVCLSMPVIISRKGIVRQIPMKLDDSEKKELEQSAKSLREIIDDVEKEQSKE
ncbi:L-lactate dehydrogenase [Aureobasidium sp. EXF-10728]|nr:L-lactate dehydrogenase [Aureobasidium sp. EXF-10728]